MGPFASTMLLRANPRNTGDGLQAAVAAGGARDRLDVRRSTATRCRHSPPTRRRPVGPRSRSTTRRTRSSSTTAASVSSTRAARWPMRRRHSRSCRQPGGPGVGRARPADPRPGPAAGSVTVGCGAAVRGRCRCRGADGRGGHGRGARRTGWRRTACDRAGFLAHDRGIRRVRSTPAPPGNCPYRDAGPRSRWSNHRSVRSRCAPGSRSRSAGSTSTATYGCSIGTVDRSLACTPPAPMRRHIRRWLHGRARPGPGPGHGGRPSRGRAGPRHGRPSLTPRPTRPRRPGSAIRPEQAPSRKRPRSGRSRGGPCRRP